jgi:choline dehydrogenase-like flavoprotein
MPEKFDVVIIGSGVAGALVAAELTAKTQKRILLLEAADHRIDGPGVKSQRVEFHRAMNLHANRGDMHAPFSRLPNRSLFAAPENASRALAEQQGGVEKYYDQKGPEPYKAPYNRLAGGSTWSWRGNVPRFIPSDFKLRSTYGIADDWPISYEELEPWYVRAEAELGVSGHHGEWSGLLGATRSSGFPMPEIPYSFGDELIRSAIDGKRVDGVTIKVVHTPQARNSRPYQERPACEGNHNCIPLCPIQAKYDATVHLNRALGAPNKLVLRTGCVVTRLASDASGRITSVHYRNWKVGPRDKESIVDAGIVVLAANALETPKLLLMSRLCPRSKAVGAYLMDHVQDEVGARLSEPVFPFRGPQSTASIEAFRDGPFRSQRSAFRMTIGNDAWGRKPGGAPIDILEQAMDQNLWGKALAARFRDSVTRMFRISFSTEQLPRIENRVELSDKLDDLGVPRPQLSYAVDEYTLKGLEHGHETALKILDVIPGIEVDPDSRKPPKGWNTAAHPMGTTRMGSDPATSVVDASGRSHDHANLYCVGASVFTTGATANPTLTLAALTLRTSEAIRAAL